MSAAVGSGSGAGAAAARFGAMRVGPGFDGALAASATGVAAGGGSAFGALSHPANSTQATESAVNPKSLACGDLWAFIGVGYDAVALKQFERV